MLTQNVDMSAREFSISHSMVRVDLSSFSLQNGTEMKVEQTDYICIKNVDVLTETCCVFLLFQPSWS